MKPSLWKLPVVAGLATLGVASGLYLGQAAVAEINPVHFAEREASTFHADLAPNRPANWTAVQVTEFRTAELGQGLGSGCVGCRAYPEEYHPRPDEALEAVYEARAERRLPLVAAETYGPARDEQPAEYEEEDPREAEWAQVERYASYPVTYEEAEAEKAAYVEAQEPEEYAGGDEAY